MTRGDVVAAARGWIGTPYHHQASRKHVGCDCLGLLRGIWREVIGLEPQPVPAYRLDWALTDRHDALWQAAHRYLCPVDAAEISPGDVLLLRWRDRLPATHCGIATSALTMVHAHDGASVAEVAISAWWWRHLAGIFTFPGLSP